ncbi:MAG: hypothetical protein AAF713_17395 [Pseudomonadota bacterium]
MQFGVFDTGIVTRSVMIKATGLGLVLSAEIEPKEDTVTLSDPALADPYAHWERRAQLAPADQMRILIDELERQTKAQARFEDAFLKLAIRVRGAEASLQPIEEVTQTQINLYERRLKREAERLRELHLDMAEAIEKIRLLDLQLKIVRFRPADAQLRAGRDECVAAIASFLEKARTALFEAEALSDQIDAGLASVETVDPAAEA